ncbi:hypothetical protein POTTS_14 [Klebsiella phage vB_KpnM_Potts1]|uniref:Uncharacterized protein n=1 Tax=Klebsiella phage vB_KpnM_Potts1 TaxID=2591366 RepID=A0A5B9NJN1_9CAUD|nr:hypothetical protein POTTS_14 [Klebsiella phage vB_KpnM_Potts1]
MTIYRNEYDKDSVGVRNIDPRMSGVLAEMAEYKEYEVSYPQAFVYNCAMAGCVITPVLGLSAFLYYNWATFTVIELILLSVLHGIVCVLGGMLIGGAIGCGIAGIIAGFKRAKHDNLKQQQAKDAEFANWIKGCRK